MKKSTLILSFIIIYSVLVGQDSLSKLSVKNQFIIQYYPSALLAGDISCGLEHRYKKKFAQELSLNVKVFQPKLYSFDKGYRSDYLIKYYLYNGNIFRLSTNLSFVYKNIYFVNKQINYYYINEGQAQL